MLGRGRSQVVQACVCKYFLSPNWYLATYLIAWAHTHTHTHRHGLSTHTDRHTPERTHCLLPTPFPSYLPSIHFQCISVDTQGSDPCAHTHTDKLSHIFTERKTFSLTQMAASTLLSRSLSISRCWNATLTIRGREKKRGRGRRENGRECTSPTVAEREGTRGIVNEERESRSLKRDLHGK